MAQNISVFMDESGDLGLSPRSTKHLTIVFLAVETSEVQLLKNVMCNKTLSYLINLHG